MLELHAEGHGTTDLEREVAAKHRFWLSATALLDAPARDGGQTAPEHIISRTLCKASLADWAGEAHTGPPEPRMELGRVTSAES